jgi:2',3'-cyclic-nucleotide 2'-phosphodiesterase (5'-nucleotidase family)
MKFRPNVPTVMEWPVGQHHENPVSGKGMIRSRFGCSGSGPATIRINGTAVDPSANYRITVNSFLADGGDNCFVLRQGTDRLGGIVDTLALEQDFAANSPVAPGPQDRITRVP